MENICWINGAFVPADRAVISAFDLGFLHGAGLFETLRAANGHLFRFTRHRERLSASIRKLGLPIDPAALPNESTLSELLMRNGLSEARLRLSASTGSRIARGNDSLPGPTILASAVAMEEYPTPYYRDGVSVSLARHFFDSNHPLAGHKALGYLPNLLALDAARRADCAETLLFTPERSLAEGAISNVFIVKDGALRTPSLQFNVLPGVAREAVLEIAAQRNIPADVEAPITIGDLLDADELFLTNVVMRVLPVTHVERRRIGTGKAGDMTRSLLMAFDGLIGEECAR